MPTVSSSLSYGILPGDLFRYGSNGLVAFESPSSFTTNNDNQYYRNKKCILLGGLSDGLLPVPYTGLLHEALCNHDNPDTTANHINNNDSWSLVQPILSSSCTGFGHGNLDRDVNELNELIQYLQNQRMNNNDNNNDLILCLIGHSTGCQDIIHYLKNGNPDYVEKIHYVVLQGPVSDREAATIPRHEELQTIEERKHELDKYIQQATILREKNQGDEMMPRIAFWAPITANRYYDLHVKGGMDDYFSSDYTDTELNQLLGHVSSFCATSKNNLQSCLVVWSGADEYVPTYIDGKKQLERIVNAMNSQGTTSTTTIAKGLYLETGNHNLSNGPNDITMFINSIKDLLL